MTLINVWQNILNGLAVGSVYAIFAVGYTLIFSILRIINFAHGAIFTIAAYFTYLLTGSAINNNGTLHQLFTNGFGSPALPVKLPFIIALLVGGLLAGLVGMLVDRVAFLPLRRRGADPLLSLVSSLGVAVAMVNLIQYFFGAEIYSYPANPFGNIPAAINFGTADTPVPVRTIQVIIFFVSIVVVVFLTWLINYTKVGKALRAVSEDAVTSSLLGINTDRIIMFTFFLSGFLGGVSGTLVGVSVGVAGPYFGIAFGLKGLAVIVLGGLGDIPGAIIGGIVLGLAEAFVPPQFVAFKEAVAFLILFLVLVIRPQGILGRAAVVKV